MCSGPVGHGLDQSGTASLCRPLGWPVRDPMRGLEIMAINTDTRASVAATPRRTRAPLPTGEPLECGDRPLVTDDVQNDWCAVHPCKRQRVMKVSFGRRALADPAHRDVILPPDCRGHGPPHR